MGSRTSLFGRLSRCNRGAGKPPGRSLGSVWRVPRVASGQQARARAARWAFGVTLLALMSFAGVARASGGREGWTFDIRLGAGLATNTQYERDSRIADFEAFVVGGALRLGGFVSPRVALGGELAVAWGSRVGEARLRDPRYASEYSIADTHGYLAPLGAFIEVYPWTREGVFLSASGGVGLVRLPTTSLGDYMAFMSRFAFELGYELSRSGKHGPAVYLHFERWAGDESVFSTDVPDGIVSSQVLAGLRWRS